jgi:serine/threonine-protein kinase
LDLRARLELMRQVCAAVQCAHQNLVVHRDLKPSNILVGPDGTVKLLDFGIAKLVDPSSSEDGLTETGTLPMTTSHASPEQLRGEAVTTATDIYSLGVILYQLVAGQSPWGRDPWPIGELRRKKLEETPPPPSAAAGAGARLPRAMSGELDQIVMMALRREPDRRYPSAEQLSQDLQRLLAGQPILAQPDSLRYRTRKFVARNRAAVAATLVVFVSLAGGLAVSLWQAHTVRRERAKSDAVSQFLQNLLSSSSPGIDVAGTRSDERTVRDVLDAAAARLESDALAAEPEVKATLQSVIGSSYLTIGQYEAAEKNLRSALATQRRLLGENSPEALASMMGLAQLAFSRADYPTAESLFRDRLAILRREFQRGKVSGKVLAASLNDFATLRRARGHSDESEPLWREVLALLPQLGPESQGERTTTETLLTLALLDQGKFAAAETEARRIVATARSGPNPEPPELCPALTILGSVLAEEGKLVEAEASLVRAERLYRRLFDSSYVATYDNVRLQAQVLLGQGRLDDAERRIGEALDHYRRHSNPRYINFATALTIHGLILHQRGRSAEAETVLREALALRRENLPAGHFMRALTEGALGEVLTSRRRFAEAESLLVSSYRSLERSQAGENARVSLAKSRLEALYTAWGRPGGPATSR